MSPIYKEMLVCVAVDEAHCVKLWGAQFRLAFSQIGDLRSIIPHRVHILALTATATMKTFHTVSHQLSLVRPVLVALPPDRQNIAHEIHPKVTIEKFVTSIVNEIKEKQGSFQKTVVYVRTYANCYNIIICSNEASLGQVFH